MRILRIHLLGLVALACALAGTAAAGANAELPLPARLSETGLFVGGRVGQVDPAHQPFAPQYPLWSDGASKRRWLSLPAGTAIDGADPDAWVFPPGTRLWKEFSLGRAVETRYIERMADGRWRFATYVWNADGSDALLAPEHGVALALPAAADGRYAIPSRADCRACHEGARVPVLGVGSLQLSSDRDPLAPHAEPLRPGDATLESLIARGWLVGLPAPLVARPPRIDAASPQESAALGYLHANCGNCHNPGNGEDPTVPVVLQLAQTAQASAGEIAAQRERLLASPVRYQPAGARAPMPLIEAGAADASLIVHRMQTRNPFARMPPLGSRVPDRDGIAAITRWIDQLPPARGTHE